MQPSMDGKDAVVRFWYDWEFIDDGTTIEPISVGIVADDGTEYYAIIKNLDTMTRAANHGDGWLAANVLCHLPLVLWTPGGPDLRVEWEHGHPDMAHVKPRDVIATEVKDFLLRPGYAVRGVELWAWFAAYDHVALAQLFGTMVELPSGIPMFTHELRQRWEEVGCPEKPAQHSAHKAITDAHWDRALWMRCEQARLGGPAVNRARR